MWVRLVLQAVFGHKFDFAWKSSARLAALAWAGSHYVVAPTEPLKPGDILYKTVGSGGFGHVGIYLLGGMVAENSSLHDDDDGDARGLRTLLEFGVYQIRVRPY